MARQTRQQDGREIRQAQHTKHHTHTYTQVTQLNACEENQLTARCKGGNRFGAVEGLCAAVNSHAGENGRLGRRIRDLRREKVVVVRTMILFSRDGEIY